MPLQIDTQQIEIPEDLILFNFHDNAPSSGRGIKLKSNFELRRR